MGAWGLSHLPMVDWKGSKWVETELTSESVSASPDTQTHLKQARTGIAGLDDILAGGFERGRVFLLEGQPGTGKTTIATQFLLEGRRSGERTLYVTLSETDDEMRAGAKSHGWDLSGIEVFELVPPENLLDDNQQQSLLYSSDLELGETTKRIFEAFEKVKPTRLVLDSLSEIRLLAQNSLRYRRQILSFKALLCKPEDDSSAVG